MKNILLLKTTFFKILFITYMFLRTLALGYFNINIDLYTLFLIVYGTLLASYHLYHKTLNLTKYHMCILSYSLILILSTFLNPLSQSSSYTTAFLQLLLFLLIFIHPKNTTLDDLNQEQRTLIPYTCLLVMIASLISLILFFMSYSSYKNGWVLGLSGGRLFGIYFNCNPASFLAIMIILLCFIALKKHYSFKFLYLLNIFIQFSYIMLTQCRSAIIILALIFIILLYYKLFYHKTFSKIKRISLNIIMCLSLLLGSFTLNKVATVIPELQGVMVQSQHRFQFEKIKEIITLTLSGQSDALPKVLTLLDQVSSGRIDLLKSSYHIWKTSPFIGIGAENFRHQLIEYKQTDKGIGKQITHTHHLFVESLVTTGIIGFILFMFFFFKTLHHVYVLLKNNPSHATYLITLLMSLILLTEFIGSLFDFGIFYMNSLSATLFWLFLGYLSLQYERK